MGISVILVLLTIALYPQVIHVGVTLEVVMIFMFPQVKSKKRGLKFSVSTSQIRRSI